MNIDIQANNFFLTDALRDYVERRLRSILSSSDDYSLQAVIVRLYDTKGLPGDACKRCHVQVVQADMPAIVIDDAEADLHIAIVRAIDRAERTLERRLADQARYPGTFLYLSCSTGHQLPSHP